MRFKNNAESVYLDSVYPRPTPRNSSRKFSFYFSAILALMILASTFTFIQSTDSTNGNSIAYADEEDDANEKFNDALKDSGYGTDENGFIKAIKSSRVEKIDKGSFSSIVKRLFTIGYINPGMDASLAGDVKGYYEKPFKSHNKYNCGMQYEENRGSYYAGEKGQNIMWHNCDVPNFLTDFVQNLAILFFNPGMQNAIRSSSYTSTKWFGFPGDMPKSVDQDTGKRVTALEVFGYNMKYTSYNGEWDHIKVMTSARALTNFGFLDRIKLSASTLFDGIVGGVSSSFDEAWSKLKKGSIGGAISAINPVNWFKRGVAISINKIIDTSDTNVFASKAWYRPGFNNTMYNSRELSQDEIGELISREFSKYILSKSGQRDLAKPPKDLKANMNQKVLKNNKPQDGVCSGSYVISSANGDVSDPISVKENKSNKYTKTHDACVNHIVRTGKKNEKLKKGETITYDETDFTQEKKVTIGDWKKDKNFNALNSKYKISDVCSELDKTKNNSTDPSKVKSFIECMGEGNGFKKISGDAVVAQQSKLNTEWVEKTIDGDDIKNFLKKSNVAFQSQASKYVCTREDGSDVVDSFGRPIPLVKRTASGREYFNKDAGCKTVRKPIQNGLFGNGYAKAGVQPPTDTRRSMFAVSLFELTGVPHFVSSSGLFVSKFTTKVSNTVLNLSFSPILKTLGVDKIIASLIEGLRDSLFFPLIVIVISISAITIFFRAGTKRDYAGQIKSLLMIPLILFSGIVIMYNPEGTIHVVDEIPSQLEKVVVGAIFETGKDTSDNVCNASSAAGKSDTLGTGSTDFSGNKVNFDPSAATRNILCENWRVFALTPYIYGQWGTSYNNLDNKDLHATGSQAKLIGKPTVHLGGSNGQNKETNWGLYQMNALTMGTTTDYNPQYSKKYDPNIYRVVDLQAGPNNGAGTDSRYLEQWSGKNHMSRMFASWLGAATSIIGAITIIVFAFAKIQISIISMLMLLFLPVMFLLGLYQGQGSYKLKGYVLEIVSLMVQRILLVTMIALLLRIITSISMSTEGFFVYSVVTIATCFAFLLFRKDIMKLFGANVVGSSGGFSTGMKASEFVPRTINQKARSVSTTYKQASYGAMGGFMAGGLKGAKQGFDIERDRGKRISEVRNAREGLGIGNVANQARESAMEETKESIAEHFDPRMNPIAEKKARKELGEDASDDEVKARQAEILKDIGPKTAKEQRRMNKFRRAEKKNNESVNAERTKDELRRNIQEITDADADTTNRTEAFDKMSNQAEASQPKRKDNPKRQRDLDESGEKLRKSLEKRYTKNTKPSDNESKEQIKQSAKEIMDDFIGNSEDDDYFQEDKGDIE